MADYDLTQTGQEVQDILDGAAMQTDLTAETERAELAEQTLQGGIDAEETRAKAAEKQNADDIDVIESKIPAGASDQNQLADKEFVNNSIATATATYRGAYNLVNDLSLTVGATHEQIATALAGAISTADNNDYCFVQIPTADATPTQIASIERYKFNGTAWAYEYTLNNSGFTAAQWAALNSGITSGLVAKLLALPTNEALTLALAGKQDVLTFDSVPVDGSNNPVKSGGVYSAIGDEETRAKAAEKANADDIDNIEALIPATASDENQLADKEYVNSSISTATATYRGSFNEVNDLSLHTDATHEQIATALAGAISTADNNDYCFVQIPTADATPTQIASIERYKFNGTAWAYEYTLNNSGFTAAQWAALNSGITSGLVAKLSALPTNDTLTLALAGKQDVLTFDNEPTNGSNNPVKSGGVYDAIDVEATTRAAAIAAIVALIPEAASALNQLADKSFVNSSISTATAVFKGTYNVVVDLELSYNATQEQIATMLASKIISADNNDYCFVQIPTADATPLQIARTDRYKYNGTVWAYEYTLNNSGFTTAQWAAINSGITSLLKDKLIDLPTATELTALLAAKQNQLTFDTTPTTGSTNPVTSGGIKSAIDTEKARAEAAEADRYTKSETYNKTEINGMVSTPHQNYVTVPTYASLPSSGQSTDTIYRVSSYDGANNQVDDTVYSEYAWDGSQYILLCVKSQIGEVFDITVYNNNTKYADLTAALGTNGANIPQSLRKGGMSVKYVQSSDNKYVQFRCKIQSFSTNPADWEGEEINIPQNSQTKFAQIKVGEKYLYPELATFENYNKLDADINGNVFQQPSQNDIINGYLGSDGIWTDNSTFGSLVINITKYRGNSITAISDGTVKQYAFLRTFNISGTSVFCNGCSRQSAFPTNDIIPNDCNYIYLLVKRDEIWMPNITITGQTEGITKRVSELEMSVYGEEFEQPTSDDVISGNMLSGGDWDSSGGASASIVLDISKFKGHNISAISNIVVKQYAFLKNFDIAGYSQFCSGCSRESSYPSDVTIPDDCNYIYLLVKSAYDISPVLPTIIIQDIEGIKPFVENLRKRVFVAYDSVNSRFTIYQRLYNTDIYTMLEVVNDKDLSDLEYVNIWRLKTNGGLYKHRGDDTFESLNHQLLVTSENEFAFKYSNTSDFTGGYHGDERIDIDLSCFVHFYIDGVRVSNDEMASSFTRWCNNFHYEQRSTLHETSSVSGQYVSGHPIIAYHLKTTDFVDGGYNSVNRLDIDLTNSNLNQIQTERLFTGLACISKDTASVVCVDTGNSIDMTGGETNYMFDGTNYPLSINLDYRGYNKNTSLSSHVSSKELTKPESGHNWLSVWDRSTDSKYYGYAPNRTFVTGDIFMSEINVRWDYKSI